MTLLNMKKPFYINLFPYMFLSLSFIFAAKQLLIFKEQYVGISWSTSHESCCGPGCRVGTTVSDYYGQQYFNWQVGEYIQSKNI